MGIIISYVDSKGNYNDIGNDSGCSNHGNDKYNSQTDPRHWRSATQSSSDLSKY